MILFFVSTIDKHLPSNQHTHKICFESVTEEQNTSIFYFIVLIRFIYKKKHDETQSVSEQFRKKNWI